MVWLIRIKLEIGLILNLILSHVDNMDVQGTCCKVMFVFLENNYLGCYLDHGYQKNICVDGSKSQNIL